MIEKRIAGYLNRGDTVAADIAISPERAAFVRIRAVPNPAVPREERRYLNSRWSMWDYWWYEFRRMELREGWEAAGYDYDNYIVADERITTKSQNEFCDAMRRLVPESVKLVPYDESECPE